MPYSVLTPPSENLGFIFETECIGDSLNKINNNFEKLDEACQALQTNITNSNSQLITQTTTTSSQLTAAPIFIPANYSVQSNALNTVQTWEGTGTKTASNAWWSGEQTVNLTNVPAGAVGALVSVYAYTSAYQGNTQNLYFYKNTEGNIWSPSVPGGAGDYTGTVPNNSYIKVTLKPGIRPTLEAPTYSSLTATPHESNTTAVFPLYFASNQFNWFWNDTKDDPGSNLFYDFPKYGLEIKILGYYVPFN